MQSIFHGYKSYYSFLWLVLIHISCNNSTQQQFTKDTSNRVTFQPKPPSGFADTIRINFPAAVFYKPDSVQLKKIRAITKPGIFESTMHEFFYQVRNAHIVLKKNYPHIKIEEAMNARYIIFEITNGKSTCIDLDTKNDPYGLYIFDTKKTPVLVDMTNIDTDLGFYFSK